MDEQKTEAIDRFELLYSLSDIVFERKYDDFVKGVEAAMKAVSSAPIIDPRPKGEWDLIYDNIFQCTHCGKLYTAHRMDGLGNLNTNPLPPNYCPDCGAYNGGYKND